MTKKYQRLINFANFANNWHIEPIQLAELIKLSHAASNAGVRECNQENAPSAYKARRRVERAADALGFVTDWPGLFPSFAYKGKTVHLPDV